MGEKLRGRPRTFDRSALLDASLEEFWQKGFAGTSITDLTAAAGCTAPTLYALFGSKEALFEEALQRYAANAFGPRAERLDAGPADRNAMEAVLRATVEAATSADHPHGCLILTGGLAEPGSAAAAAVAKLRAFVLEGLKRFLDRAQRDGHLGAGDVEALARYYLAVLQGIAAQAFDGATPAELGPVVEAALAAWPTPSPRQR